jgi:hypothetical protein
MEVWMNPRSLFTTMDDGFHSRGSQLVCVFSVEEVVVVPSSVKVTDDVKETYRCLVSFCTNANARASRRFPFLFLSQSKANIL